MVTLGERPYSIMVLYAVVLHLSWAFILILDNGVAVNATAVGAVYQYIHPVGALIIALVFAAVCAALGLFLRNGWFLLLLLPQQIILMMSASGCIEAIWLSQFADGIVRARPFIAADQLYSVVAALGHMVAIIAQARNGGR